MLECDTGEVIYSYIITSPIDIQEMSDEELEKHLIQVLDEIEKR